jgi:hypothetical protein
VEGVTDKDKLAVHGDDSGSTTGNASMGIVSKKDDVSRVGGGSVQKKYFVMWEHVIRCSRVGTCRGHIVSVALEDFISCDLENAVGMIHEGG